MPPPEEWPDAIRPPIQGKAKILDGILKGTRVKLVKDTRKLPPPDAAHKSSTGLGNTSAQSLMDSLAPMMLEWLRTSLAALGLGGAAGESEKEDTRSVKNRKKGQKGKEETPKVPNPTPKSAGAGKGGIHPTTVPNQKLWSVVAGEKVGGNAHPTPSERKAEISEPATIPGSEAWTEVKNRKKKPKKASLTESRAPITVAGRAKTRVTAAKPVATKRAEGKGEGTLEKKVPKRKPPRTAAVTLTCPPGEYAEAMKIVRGKINLTEIGIESLRPKRAATGAIILEVPGPDSSEKASVLRDKMEEALQNMEGVKVARPTKQGELRVKNILDSTTVAEIKEAISRLGGCKAEEVRAGDIRQAPNGLGTLDRKSVV